MMANNVAFILYMLGLQSVFLGISYDRSAIR